MVVSLLPRLQSVSLWPSVISFNLLRFSDASALIGKDHAGAGDGDRLSLAHLSLASCQPVSSAFIVYAPYN